MVLWEASDRVCGKRLKPLLPILVPALERHGHIKLDGTVREKLLAASASTIDRRLARTRNAARGRMRARAAIPRVRRQVPVKTFADWKEPESGFMEADLACGFCRTCQPLSLMIRCTFFRFTGLFAFRRTTAVINRTPCVGFSSITARICSQTSAWITGGDGDLSSL